MRKEKRYIGDGVYIEFNGYQLKLTTEDGISVTNEIYLEPSVFDSLEIYVQEIKAAMQEQPQ